MVEDLKTLGAMKKMKKNYFNVCENCGSTLDPGETCDCKNKEVYYTCIYCGAEVKKDESCECSERARIIEQYIQIADELILEQALSISFSDIGKLIKTAGSGMLGNIFLAYKLGIVVASELYRKKYEQHG